MKTDGTDGTTRQVAPTDTIGAMIERLKPQLERALPKHVTAERLSRVALTAIRNNRKLQQADALSLMGSIMTAAQLGLEPNTPLGQCYIIPYNNSKTGVQAQFQMGYKGVVELAHRTREYKRISARVVDEADKFDYSYGLDEFLIHVPSDKPTGKAKAYYAVYELVNGGRSFVVWSKEKVTQHAKRYSKSFSKEDSAWQTAFDSMACKTVLIDLLRYAPKSVELTIASSADNRTMTISPDDPDLNIDAIEGEFELEAEQEEKTE